MLSGRMRLSLTYLPMGLIIRLVRERVTTMCIRCFIPRPCTMDFGRDTKQRALILSRDAYTGAQHNGAIFWSSDIYPTWDTLRRQIPTGLDATASGIAYWGNDIGGWQYSACRPSHPAHKLALIDPSDARENVGGV